MIWINTSRKQVIRVLLLLAGIIVATSFIYKELKVEAEKEPYFFMDYPYYRLAFTFEISWGPGNLKEILVILKKEKVQATFFLTGTWIEAFPDEAKAIVKDGHELGNHSYSHTSFLNLSQEQISAELAGFAELAKETLNVQPHLFRPPFGEYNSLVIDLAGDMGYHTVLWSLETNDYLAKDSDEIISRVVNQLHCGAIIKFRVGAEHLPQALAPLIRSINDQGYQIVTVSELIKP